MKVGIIGQLELTRPTSVEEIGGPVMQHDPTRLTDGIEPSHDPVGRARLPLCRTRKIDKSHKENSDGRK